MYTHTLNKQKGFTLIELLLYMAISSVIVFVISGVSIDMLRASQKTENLQEVGYVSSFVLATLQRISSGAYAVTNPASTATSSSVTFSMYDPLLDPSVVSLVDGVLYLQEGTAAPIPLHSNDMQSTVTYSNKSPLDGYHSVQVQLGVSIVTESLLASEQAHLETATTLTLQYTP
ncbi:MAG: prepilin-type N-terminal cleavage/methylation domain-containing protein [Acidimicrobiales bacterium]|jgi:prepilin-type N-terminal cleavage/methylation domain-containing protein